MIKQNRLSEALSWVKGLDLSPDDDLYFLREFDHITLARVLLAQYKKDQQGESFSDAIRLLERLLKEAENGNRLGSMIEIRILKALVYEVQSDIARAMEILEHALRLAEPEGYIRIFVDEGASMARLLYEALARGIEPAYVRRLLAAFPVADSEPAALSLPPDAEAGLIEPLSMRELEVLQVIAEGLSNQEVAQPTLSLVTYGQGPRPQYICQTWRQEPHPGGCQGKDSGYLVRNLKAGTVLFGIPNLFHREQRTRT